MKTPIEKQHGLALRIATDFRKEAVRHRVSGNKAAAVECESLEDGMMEIATTLKAAGALQSSLAEFLGQNDRSELSRPAQDSENQERPTGRD